MQTLLFLGTGGGRFATIYQGRATGGVYLYNKRARLSIDPGPGALVHMHRLGLNPTKVDAVLVSHGHPDHYTDAEILIESLTMGGTKQRGTLLASKSIIEGYEEIGPVVSPYHREKLNYVIELGDNGAMQRSHTIGSVVIEAIPAIHSDPTATGFKFHTEDGIISYVCDTAFDETIIDHNRDARVLILPVTTGRRNRIQHHLCTEDAATIVSAIKPEITFITHFGLKMIRSGPDKEAQWIEQKTGVRTIAARDFMKVRIDESIFVEK